MNHILSAFVFALSAVVLGCSVGGLEHDTSELGPESQGESLATAELPANTCEVTAGVDGCKAYGGGNRYWINASTTTYIQLCPGEKVEDCLALHNSWAKPQCIESVFVQPLPGGACAGGQLCSPQIMCNSGSSLTGTGCEYMISDGQVVWTKGPDADQNKKSLAYACYLAKK